MLHKVRAARCARWAAIVFAFCATTVWAQSIQTYAGGGNDDGQLATDITLYGPRGIAYDAAGNLYIVEVAGIVRRVDKNGTVLTIAGNFGAGYGGDGGPARNATLNRPGGIAIDRNGDLYVADSFNGRVRKISAATGVITTVAGRGSDRPDGTLGDGGPATDAVLRGPWAISLDQTALYITEIGYKGQRVRKVVRATGTITTIAGPADGDPGFTGDGGPATSARFNNPFGVAVDVAGNVFISDADNDRVRRVDAATGIIDTYAGGGSPADGIGDGGPATAAKLDGPRGLVLDPGGNLLVATLGGVRRIDKATRVISTVSGYGSLAYFITVDASGTPIISSDGNGEVLRPAGGNDFVTIAGGGSYIGDGLNAKAAIFRDPLGMALDAKGNLFVADAGNRRVRRVDAATGIATTSAGSGGAYDDPSDDGTAAITAPMIPVDLAFDPNGDLYICDALNGRVKKVSTATGILTFFAGGGPQGTNNEGVTAKAAYFNSGSISGICFDPTGNLYVADRDAARVWRIDAKSGIVNAFAGNGTGGFAGDGGPATSAMLDHPIGVVSDSKGNIYIADSYNARVRRVGRDGVITTFAGDGTETLPTEHIAVDPRNDDIYVADDYRSSVRKVDSTGKITTVAGAGTAYFVDADYQGDGGPATAALMNFPFELSGIAVSKSGDLYVSDSGNNRVRAVFACGSVTAATPKTPADGAAGADTAPALTWTDVPRAFRYDLRLDTVNPPQKVAASDLSQTSFVPSNLQSGTKYYWQVIAKGDPFCTPLSTAASAVASFTTGSQCGVGDVALTSPADSASNVSQTVQLTWQAASGAASYDVYFGSANPPPLVAAGISATTYAASSPGGRYYWFVVAHAACDSTKTSTSVVRSFSTLSTTCTPGQIGVTTSAPSNGAPGQSLTLDLKWSPIGSVEIFDVYFGTDPNPPLRFANVSGTTQSVSSLLPSTTYYWRVVARGPCDPNGIASPVVSFTTHGCTAPGAVSIDFVPATVSAGATYSIVWSQATGADQDAGYLVERSTSADFSSADVQVTSSTAASFIASASGTYYHRVRAVAGCDVSVAGPVSQARAVTVTPGRPNVVFTQQPAAVITGLGQALEDFSTSFALENLGGDPVQIVVGRQELNGARPFFSIADPAGGDAGFVTLQPHQPRVFNVRFSGPKNDAPASYQGVIFVASTGQGLSVTPYAFVNLKVGGSPATAPQFVVSGAPAEYAAFPGFAGDDSARPPLVIGVKNNGSTPVEVGFDIGPEVWLTTDASWNATQIEPGATRSVSLSTQRARAPNGSPLPRYTYLTVRTKDGASSRLLVQDNDDIAVTNGRTIRLDASARSFIVPEVVSRADATSVVATRIRLANIGSDAVQAEMLFTPAGVDGFDAANVRRATVVVPANDAVAITDPLAQIFRMARPAAGQIEIRLPRERIGLVSASATTLAFAGSGSYGVPVINRGEGAVPGAPHVLPGIVRSASLVSSLVLAETSGIDHAAVRVTLISAAGLALGTVDSDVPRYGYVRFDDVVAACGATAVDAARLDIRVTAGGGSVTGLAIVHAPGAISGASLSSVPAAGIVSSSAVAQIMRRTAQKVSMTGHKAQVTANAAATAPGISIVVPVVGTATSSGAAPAYKTGVGLTAPAGNAIDFVLTFRGSASLAKTVNVLAGTTKSYQDVLSELFSLPPTSQGSIFVDAPEGSLVHATLAAANGGSPSTFIPLPTSVSEALTSASSAARPLYVEGLEQSTDSTRGSRAILMLNEIGGASGTVQILLYESGNRSTPIAAREFSLAPYQQLQLDTVFAQLGLDTPPRRKDRANVQCVVVATRGSARIAASAISIDNATGETKVTALAPAVGSGPPGVSVVSAVIPSNVPPAPSRRRVAKH